MDSIPSTFTNGSCSPNSEFCINKLYNNKTVPKYLYRIILSQVQIDPDISPDEQEEKARLIAQVLELQNTLDGKSILENA